MATSPLLFTLFHICLFCLKSVSATTNITTTQFLNNSETIVSSNARFKMGFFSPINSTNRYVGIWYNIKDSVTKEVVWVANRNNPVKDSSGVLQISEDGNLQVLDGEDKILWSSNVSHQANTTSVAQLQDTGNLVLMSSASGKVVWQSFEHHTNAMLPHMRISIDLSIVNQGFNQDNMYPILQSWKSASDPSNGRFRVGIIRFPITEFIVRNGDETYWRSGSSNGTIFLGVRASDPGFHIVYDDNQTRLDVSYTAAFTNESMLEHFVLNHDGNMVLKIWDAGSRKWSHFWQSIQSECDIFGKCGPFGRCNPKGSPICDCLHGFEPKNKEEWGEGNWTSGCVRRRPLLCGVTGPNEDKFLKLKHMKPSSDISVWPDYDQDACRRRCMDTCPCVAYAHPIGIGCVMWQNLIDIQEFSSHGADIFIRLAYSELGNPTNRKTIIAVIATVAAATFVVFTYCLWSLMHRRHVKRYTNDETQFDDAGVDRAEFKDLPLFKFNELEVATFSFSEINKLGEGGFGSVYKGKLENGQEIAVKRLSRASGQGLQEFMNEVLVISKLQHKNLVRLLGCCLERNEKLLVYEFMPNKSLDSLLFDPHRGTSLDWKKRFHIINGISRGLLYLHRDSRLKIIHRDLKASNILLDKELNPKISDFGMARIFATKQDQANTLRVVGTYGYMSPEYAMEGRFSEKSDIFGLGVLLLEIISGRKNSSFLKDDSLGLLSYTWKLWNENDVLSLIDPSIQDPSFQDEIMKCIQLGLLSVQEYPEDRPNISDLVSMLDVNDIMELPLPTKPGFIQRKAWSSDDAVQNQQEHCSVNHVSLTTISGR